MKIDRAEALARARAVSYRAGKSNHPWTTQEDMLADAIEVAVRETAEECAEIAERGGTREYKTAGEVIRRTFGIEANA